jgi:hypothetical protein
MNARELLEELLNYVEFDINDELTEKVQAYLAQPETKREPVLLSDEAQYALMENPDIWYGFNDDKIDWKTLIPIVEQAVLKANGIGTDND